MILIAISILNLVLILYLASAIGRVMITLTTVKLLAREDVPDDLKVLAKNITRNDSIILTICTIIPILCSMAMTIMGEVLVGIVSFAMFMLFISLNRLISLELAFIAPNLTVKVNTFILVIAAIIDSFLAYMNIPGFDKWMFALFSGISFGILMRGLLSPITFKPIGAFDGQQHKGNDPEPVKDAKVPEPESHPRE